MGRQVQAKEILIILSIVAHIDVPELIPRSEMCIVGTFRVHVHEVCTHAICCHHRLVGGVLQMSTQIPIVTKIVGQNNSICLIGGSSYSYNVVNYLEWKVRDKYHSIDGLFKMNI